MKKIYEKIITIILIEILAIVLAYIISFMPLLGLPSNAKILGLLIYFNLLMAKAEKHLMETEGISE